MKYLLLFMCLALASCGASGPFASMDFLSDGSDVEAKLRAKGEYEYNLVGRRLTCPIDDVLMKRLADHPEEDSEHDYVLYDWILRVGVEHRKEYQYLLASPSLRAHGGYDGALLAYDYNVNGNLKAFENLLKRIRVEMKKAKGWNFPHLYALGAIDEWNSCREVLGSVALSADGAGDDARYAFWLTRRHFYPKNDKFPADYRKFCDDLEAMQARSEHRAAGNQKLEVNKRALSNQFPSPLTGLP